MTCRNKLLGIPTRAKQRLPGLTTADVLILDALIREALEALSNPEQGEQK
jgi:phage terminase Nu1 subunit (DNA packaging protein)